MPTTPGGRPPQGSGQQPGRRVGRLRGFEQRPLRPVSPSRRHQAPDHDAEPAPRPLPTYGRAPQHSPEPPGPEPEAARQQDTTTWIILRTPVKKAATVSVERPAPVEDTTPMPMPVPVTDWRDTEPLESTLPPRPKPAAPKTTAPKPRTGVRKAGVGGSLLTARNLLAFAVVLAVAVPLVLMLVRDGGSSGQSSPLGAYPDDKYRTQPTAPASAKQAPTTAPTRPTAVPSGEPTTTPSQSAAPSRTTTEPSRRASRPPATARPTSGSTGQPTVPPAQPTAPTTSTPPDTPPPDSGGMSETEQQVFTMIDDARVERGCARLSRDSALTEAARRYSTAQAEDGKTKAGDGTEAIASADDPNDAYRHLMGRYSRTLLDCDHTDLGIGYGSAEGSGVVCGLLGTCGTEQRWSANFN